MSKPIRIAFIGLVTYEHIYDQYVAPVKILDPLQEAAALASALKPQVESFEREIILRALAASGGTRREAARLLKVSLRTLFYKLRRYGLA